MVTGTIFSNSFAMLIFDFLCTHSHMSIIMQCDPNRWVLRILGIEVLNPVGIGCCSAQLITAPCLLAGRESHKHPTGLTLSTPDCPEVSPTARQYLWLTPTLSANCTPADYLLDTGTRLRNNGLEAGELKQARCARLATHLVDHGSQHANRRASYN